ncbi:P-loop containing nucleoside triphosphate hydrolase protein [Cristinia sonorae]|uniref:P-loop containing nucleoside triphosphate hydrolase protein n=1 Tax=Cristinia sonorae TaxID=1940300 RepID=A0A8K0UP94_9AGAR|nr:P-loop containing nucleoside triphosphate hydrolase protein [Cristinia sonorae]
MNTLSSDLAQYLIERMAKADQSERLLVGIAGVPASGKSTLAQLIVDDVNGRLAATHPSEQTINDFAVLVGLDGWHLTRAQLDALPDPVEAHARRGAHWTFDGDGYVAFVRSLRKPIQASAGDNGVIRAPSFLHAIKDPSPDAVSILPSHRLVVIEGLYTFLSTEPWVEAGKALDERWWVEISEEDAEKRLVPRHVRTGVAKDLAEAIWRARENDAPNGRFIKANLLEPTRVITAIDDPLYITDDH